MMPLFVHRKLVKLLVHPYLRAHEQKHQTIYSRLIRAAWRKL